MDLDTRTFPPRAKGAMFKGQMATAKQEREQKQAKVRGIETKGKREARQRDGASWCRLFGERCAYAGRTSCEGAHARDKKAGGDHGLRSTSADILRACAEHHRGGHSLHSKNVKVVYLTKRGCNGPIAVYERTDTSKRNWTLVRRETESDVRPH